ncbi:MAG: hypothetical protein WA751_05190, partial [Candidatus Dormiibacterota bacterium]
AADFFAALRGLPTPARTIPAQPAPTPAVASNRGAPQTFPSALQPVVATPRPSPARTTPEPLAPSVGASDRWPTDPPLTPASLRAQSLPFRTEGGSDGSELMSESTQLIAMEPYRFEPKFRRRGGYLVIWFLLLLVAAAAVLLVTGRIGF